MEKIQVYTVTEIGGEILYALSLEVLLETLKYELEELHEGDLRPFNFGMIYMTQQ